jgi:hypothetical protein
MRVTDVLELLAAGAAIDEILANYPYPGARGYFRGHRIRRPPSRSSNPEGLVRFL